MISQETLQMLRDAVLTTYREELRATVEALHDKNVGSPDRWDDAFQLVLTLIDKQPNHPEPTRFGKEMADLRSKVEALGSTAIAASAFGYGHGYSQAIKDALTLMEAGR